MQYYHISAVTYLEEKNTANMKIQHARSTLKSIFSIAYMFLKVMKKLEKYKNHGCLCTANSCNV